MPASPARQDCRATARHGGRGSAPGRGGGGGGAAACCTGAGMVMLLAASTSDMSSGGSASKKASSMPASCTASSDWLLNAAERGRCRCPLHVHCRHQGLRCGKAQHGPSPGLASARRARSGAGGSGGGAGAASGCRAAAASAECAAAPAAGAEGAACACAHAARHQGVHVWRSEPCAVCLSLATTLLCTALGAAAVRRRLRPDHAPLTWPGWAHLCGRGGRRGLRLLRRAARGGQLGKR